MFLGFQNGNINITLQKSLDLKKMAVLLRDNKFTFTILNYFH